MKKLNVFLLGFVAVLAFSSCQKEEDVDIVYGNTNMLSKTLTVYGSQWYFVDPTYVVDIPVAEINQSTMDNGAVMVYYRNGYGEWQAMPNTIPVTSTYASVYAFSYWNGYVSLYKTDTDLITGTPGDMDVKIVVLSLKAMMENQDVNWNSYSEVSSRFNLK
jgi:hypothetical protein